jgi:hypothetical protein
MRVRVTFETTIDKDVSAEQVKEWLEFLLWGGGLFADHPLVNDDLEADLSSITVEEL